MFMGPLEQVKPWSTHGVEGTFRFLSRVWRLFMTDAATAAADDTAAARLRPELVDAEPTDAELKLLHRTIAKVTDDFDGLRFNTAIAALMEFTNAANKWPRLPRAIAEPFLLLLAPLAPHLAEELWSQLGHAESLAYAPWPEHDPRYLVAETLIVAVQINGKVRARIEVPADADEDTALGLAHADANVSRYLAGAVIRRAIYVPGRIVNFVLGS
jgi:leucyl-tRNA synthetase